MPYIFEVVNVTTYIWLYTWILMYWTAALEIPISRCILCVSIYMHMCICSMHSLHGCDVSRTAVLIFRSLCIFQCVVSSFSVLSRRTACFAVANACCFLKHVGFFWFFFFLSVSEWTSVQSASTGYCLTFDNHFLFSETLTTNSICTV